MISLVLWVLHIPPVSRIHLQISLHHAYGPLPRLIRTDGDDQQFIHLMIVIDGNAIIQGQRRELSEGVFEDGTWIGDVQESLLIVVES